MCIDILWYINISSTITRITLFLNSLRGCHMRHTSPCIEIANNGSIENSVCRILLIEFKFL